MSTISFSSKEMHRGLFMGRKIMKGGVYSRAGNNEGRGLFKVVK